MNKLLLALPMICCLVISGNGYAEFTAVNAKIDNVVCTFEDGGYCAITLDIPLNGNTCAPDGSFSGQARIDSASPTGELLVSMAIKAWEEQSPVRVGADTPCTGFNNMLSTLKYMFLGWETNP